MLTPGAFGNPTDDLYNHEWWEDGVASQSLLFVSQKKKKLETT